MPPTKITENVKRSKEGWPVLMTGTGKCLLLSLGWIPGHCLAVWSSVIFCCRSWRAENIFHRAQGGAGDWRGGGGGGEGWKNPRVWLSCKPIWNDPDSCNLCV